MAVTGPFVHPYKNKNPGPGNYEHKSGLSKTCYSMAGKNYRVDKEKLKTPGPGTCNSSFIIRWTRFQSQCERKIFLGQAPKQLRQEFQPLSWQRKNFAYPHTWSWNVRRKAGDVSWGEILCLENSQLSSQEVRHFKSTTSRSQKQHSWTR